MQQLTWNNDVARITSELSLNRMGNIAFSFSGCHIMPLHLVTFSSISKILEDRYKDLY